MGTDNNFRDIIAIQPDPRKPNKVFIMCARDLAAVLRSVDCLSTSFKHVYVHINGTQPQPDAQFHCIRRTANASSQTERPVYVCCLNIILLLCFLCCLDGSAGLNLYTRRFCSSQTTFPKKLIEFLKLGSGL